MDASLIQLSPRPPADEFIPQYANILNAPLPSFRGNIRSATRKERAAMVRALFRDMGLKGISVTAPNYSMAQSIDIRFHVGESAPWLGRGDSPHERKHTQINEEQAELGEWRGYNKFCPWCHEEWEAHNKLEKIILAAFPDLDNRSDSQTDYFDYCLSIQ